MNKFLAMALIAGSISTFAQSKPMNFLEIGITKWDYKKPLKEGNGGVLQFTYVTLSRADLTFNLKNKKNVFDAKTIYRKDYLGFETDYMSIDFNMGLNSGFDDIKRISILNNDAVVNPSFFSLQGRQFSLNTKETKIDLNHFSMFCTSNDLDLDMASAEGIEQGCLTELSITPKTMKAPFKLGLEIDYEDGDKMLLNAELGTIDLLESSLLSIRANKVDMKVSNYFLETDKVELDCLKDEDLKTFDSEKIMKDCENSLSLKANKILLRNKVEETKFYINADELNIVEQKVFFSAPVLQFVDKKSSVTIYDLSLKCQKSDQATVYDLHSLIGECLKSGTIIIPNLISRDEESLYWDYENIMKGGFDPVARISKKEKTARNIEISIDNGNAIIKASAYKKVLGKYLKFDVMIKGTTEHFPSKDQIVLTVDEIKVPIGWFKIKWKKFLLGIVKKAMVGEKVHFNGDKITIQL